MLAHAPNVADRKRALREAALARRDALAPDLRAAAAMTIAKGPFPVEVPNGAVVSGFSPIGKEINAVPLMRRLADGGARLALPAVVGRGQPLQFRAWAFRDPLVSGVWGIREPTPEAPEVSPDILIVPLAAFDRAGYRIGYGAGYFDMTLADLRARKTIVAIGIAFAAQEVDEVPIEAHDQRLDYVLTEAGVRVANPVGRA